MDFRFIPPDLRRLDDSKAELLACAMWSDKRPLRGVAGLLDWRLAGRLSGLLRDGFMAGALGDVLLVPVRPRLPFEKLLVLGLGAHADFGEDAFRQVIRRLLESLEGMRIRRAIVELPGRSDNTVTPERATELVLECAGTSTSHDA